MKKLKISSTSGKKKKLNVCYPTYEDKNMCRKSIKKLMEKFTLTGK